MGYRTLLVHVDPGRQAPARIAAAAALALQHDAHLVGLAATGWTLMPTEATPSLGLAAYQEAALQALREQADACIARFEAQLRQLGVTRFESRVDIGYPESAMVAAARCCDLTVVSQLDPEGGSLAAPSLVAQDLLMQSGRPVLLLPFAGPTSPPYARALVAWNGSREAARAVKDALPLLRRAQVEVVVFDAPEDAQGAPAQLPGADIGPWLARHGVDVELRHVPVSVAAGEALLSHAADMGADLIVAGGYGHSRLRELVMGGVTRTLMHSAPVPVLLSH